MRDSRGKTAGAKIEVLAPAALEAGCTLFFGLRTVNSLGRAIRLSFLISFFFYVIFVFLIFGFGFWTFVAHKISL
jgi:hypothetical protein